MRGSLQGISGSQFKKSKGHVTNQNKGLRRTSSCNLNRIPQISFQMVDSQHNSGGLEFKWFWAYLEMPAFSIKWTFGL